LKKKSNTRELARTKKRRSVERRLEDVGRKIEDRVMGVADRALDVVDENIDRWLEAATARLLESVGLAAPTKITMKGDNGKTIELSRQPDGSYAQR
jgi:hypothetical protein